MLLATLGAEQGQAQTGNSRVFVSSINEDWASNVLILGRGGATGFGQAFTTGDDRGGYLVDHVTWRIHTTVDKKNLDLQASIREANGSSPSNSNLITMRQNSPTAERAHNFFHAPSNSAVLRANTKYFMVLECINNSCGGTKDNTALLRYTLSDDEDNFSASDWSLGNNHASKSGGWSNGGTHVMIVSLDGWRANRRYIVDNGVRVVSTPTAENGYVRAGRPHRD